ncbi:MAG: hypothetical protein IJT59_07285 [Desulfovibrionaceae bacterium]|nr:hypothetical protein [Desulfovibrionaceae bacterium]
MYHALSVFTGALKTAWAFKLDLTPWGFKTFFKEAAFALSKLGSLLVYLMHNLGASKTKAA